MILSVSRRTDIPAFYSQWLLNRLKAGSVLVRNPVNHSQIRSYRLSPETVDCIVLWTKDPQNMMEQLSELDKLGYSYYFQFTLTPYGKDLEPGIRDKDEICQTFVELSKRIGKERVLWRYDPIILNDTLTIDWHQEQFKCLCKILGPYTDVCTISFVDVYAKLSEDVKKRLVRTILPEEMEQICRSFHQTARRHGITLKACCEQADLTRFGVAPASCIDQSRIEGIIGCCIEGKKDKNQRPGCGCIQSVDIGAYNSCPHGCVYCYANFSGQSVEETAAQHDPNSPMVLGYPQPGEKITQNPSGSLKYQQISLL